MIATYWTGRGWRMLESCELTHSRFEKRLDQFWSAMDSTMDSTAFSIWHSCCVSPGRSDELFSEVQLLLEDNVLELQQIRKIADTASGFLNEVYNACPFAMGTALLALCRTAQLSSSVQVSDADFSYLTMDAIKTWDAMSGDRVGLKRHFFYDLLTTRWPWMSLLDLNHPERIFVSCLKKDLRVFLLHSASCLGNQQGWWSKWISHASLGWHGFGQ